MLRIACCKLCVKIWMGLAVAKRTVQKNISLQFIANSLAKPAVSKGWSSTSANWYDIGLHMIWIIRLGNVWELKKTNRNPEI